VKHPLPRHPVDRQDLGRRAFLGQAARMAGGLWVAGSAASVLAACSSDDEPEESGGTSATTGAAGPDDLVLGVLFDPSPSYARTGIEQRLTFGMFLGPGAPMPDPPAELPIRLDRVGADGATTTVIDDEVLPLRSEGLPRGYYALRFTPDTEGVHTVVADHDGTELTASFEVGPPEGPGVVQIGSPMPVVETATTANPLGVEPLCTRDTNCGFHDISLDEALSNGSPVVLSVSTPAYCAVTICGPVLDLVVDAAPRLPDVTYIHTEPFLRPVPGDPYGNGVAAVMEELGLTFEPSLFLIAPDGTLANRLDTIYDAGELNDALDALTA
jgi:hypothetical protein